jgi:hypothetical protein
MLVDNVVIVDRSNDASVPVRLHQSKKSQIHITHVKPVVIGFAFGRSASQRSQGIPGS